VVRDLLAGGAPSADDATDDGATFPNRALLTAGLLAVREVRGRRYADLHASRAFALVDHEVAHVYVRHDADIPAVRAAIQQLPGVGDVLDRARQADHGVAHANSGELVLVAGPGRWFAYPWWTRRRRRPDYASHVDIHNKPGYDPCELLWGWPPMSTSQDTRRIRGSHGKVGPGREVAWAATWDLPGSPGSVVELATAVRQRLG
jgi:hypothetical protein